MTFFKNSGVALSAAVILASCGSPKPSHNTVPEKTVEKPAVTAENEAKSPEVSPTEETAKPPATAEVASEFASLPEPYISADYARGRRTFKLCQSCHTLKEGGSNLVGPNLHGIFGRQVGSVDGFSYSKAVQEADFVWTPEVLEQWLESPRGFLPGNNMNFAGVRRPDDRTAVIAYIMVETGWTSSE